MIVIICVNFDYIYILLNVILWVFKVKKVERWICLKIWEIVYYKMVFMWVKNFFMVKVYNG